MDQNPLPRGSLQICDRLGEVLGTVPELAEAAVAVEAQYPAYPPGAVIVIEVFRVGRAADRAAPALRLEKLAELHLPHAVGPAQVAIWRPATEPPSRLDTAPAATGLGPLGHACPAMGGAAVGTAGVAVEVSEGQEAPALGADLDIRV
jgi:hypothetical protein